MTTLHAQNKALDDFGAGRYSNCFRLGTDASNAYIREWRGVARDTARENPARAVRKILPAIESDSVGRADGYAARETGAIFAEAAAIADRSGAGRKRKIIRDALAKAFDSGSFARSYALAGYDDRISELLGGPGTSRVAAENAFAEIAAGANAAYSAANRGEPIG